MECRELHNYNMYIYIRHLPVHSKTLYSFYNLDNHYTVTEIKNIVTSKVRNAC